MFYNAKILIILSVLLSATHAAASVSSSVEKGNEAFLDGNYELSVQNYEEALEKAPNSAIIQFNTGTAYYKAEDYTNAVKYLEQSLLGDDEALTLKAKYNLGNAYYKYGISKEEEDIEEAILELEKSLNQYENIIEAHDDEDAQANYEFVKKELERLKQKQQMQQQQQELQENQQSQDSQEQQNNQQQENQEQQGQQQEQNQKQQESQEQSSEGQQGQEQQQSGEQGEQSQEQEEQSAQQSSDEEQDNKEEMNQQSSSQEQENQDEGEEGQSAQSYPISSEELTEQEAKMILKQYLQNEEPSGLLNFQKNEGEYQPVLKDW